ncbi:MAG TPA: hypothetical protein VFQ34_02050 [Nitrospiraceae bacterium]|jgi:hypothetical protein|nr:hypothetical protein [Nitrospiraceae bacterium]
MLTLRIRKEVLDFINASETILSSVLIKPPLTQEERGLIAEYLRYLSDVKQPWNGEECLQASADEWSQNGTA